MNKYALYKRTKVDYFLIFTTGDKWKRELTTRSIGEKIVRGKDSDSFSGRRKWLKKSAEDWRRSEEISKYLQIDGLVGLRMKGLAQDTGWWSLENINHKMLKIGEKLLDIDEWRSFSSITTSSTKWDRISTTKLLYHEKESILGHYLIITFVYLI